MREVNEAIKAFSVRMYEPDVLQVYSAKRIVEKLNIEVNEGSKNIIHSLYGIRVVERKWVPKDKAYLIDKTGKIIQVFNL